MSANIAYYGGIVTDGLVLYLDAAKRDSYPGFGNSWSSVARGQSISATLINGPNFSYVTASSIVFDGVNDYITIPSNQIWRLVSSSTINIWFNASSSAGNLVNYQKGGWEGYTITPLGVSYSGQAGSNDCNLGYSYTLNSWAMVSWIVDRTLNLYSVFLNGVQIGASQPITHPALTTASPLFLGARGAVPDQFMTGRISNFSFYTKALSATEILQNYNAQRGRFGL